MQEYIFVFIGAVAFFSIFEYVSPNGKTAKSLKAIFSAILVILIMSPIVNIINGDNNFSTQIFNDEEYLSYLYNYQDKIVEREVNTLLTNQNCEVIEVVSSTEYLSENQTVKTLKIILNNEVINSTDEHINILENVKNLVVSRLNLINWEITVEYGEKT